MCGFVIINLYFIDYNSVVINLLYVVLLASGGSLSVPLTQGHRREPSSLLPPLAM